MFVIDRSELEPGDNRLQLVARLADGRRAVTPVQSVRATGPTKLAGARRRDVHRFSVLDPHWHTEIAQHLTEEDQLPGQAVARLVPGDEIALALPPELTGEFDLIVQTRGPSWPKAFELESFLVRDAEQGEASCGRARIHGWWNFHEAGRVTLAGGAQELRLRCDEPQAADGERCWLRSIALRTRGVDDHLPPRVVLRYPAEGHQLGVPDVVVAEGWDDDRLARADLVVDGQPAHVWAQLRQGVGHLLLPVVARELEPGEHTLSVRVWDEAGNLGESAPVHVVVGGDEAQPALGTYARAERLLNRFGYGPEPEELAYLLAHSEEAWIEARLGALDAGDQAAWEHAVLSSGNLAQHEVRQATLSYLQCTTNPVRARLLVWLDNHFSTFIGKARPAVEWRELAHFRRLGPTAFVELLSASATSPAMLAYLDQSDSTAARINENYARELLELHSLGVDGGYVQRDVTTLAHALCGLTLSQEAPADGAAGELTREFRYDPGLGDGVTRELLGLRLEARAASERFDNLRAVLELCAAHPSTARHVARKLAEHYVAQPAPEQLVVELTRLFQSRAGDLSAMLAAIMRHPALFAAPVRVADPLEPG